MDRDKGRKPHQSKLQPIENKFHVGNGDDGKHYWITPPALYPGELSATVDAIFAKGYNFACEDLGDGYVSLTIEGPDEDVDIEIVPNQPGQPHVGLVAMIRRFSERGRADGQ